VPQIMKKILTHAAALILFSVAALASMYCVVQPNVTLAAATVAVVCLALIYALEYNVLPANTPKADKARTAGILVIMSVVAIAMFIAANVALHWLAMNL